MKMRSTETARRGRPDKIAPMKLHIARIFISHSYNDLEVYGKLKDDLQKTIGSEHPEWDPDQLNAEIDNKIPAVRTIAAFRRSLELRQAEIEASGADRPWQSGMLLEHPLPPETLPKIYSLKAKHPGLVLTTRMAQWMGRLCHLRLSDDWLYYLCEVYATKERISQLAGMPLDLADEDSRLSELMASGEPMPEIPTIVWQTSQGSYIFFDSGMFISESANFYENPLQRTGRVTPEDVRGRTQERVTFVELNKANPEEGEE